MTERKQKASAFTVDKLKPNDPRAKRAFAEVNGRKWYYLDAASQGAQKGTIFLIHGFPDLSFAWRYQIPMLTSLGFRCIALDCMGYGATGTSDNLHDFSFKTHADAVAGIARAEKISHAVIGGHDWGGMTVYRVAQWHPELITHVFSVCTAYMAPTKDFISVEQLTKSILPQFGYQLQWGSDDGKLEAVVNDEVKLRRFLNGTYGGKPKSGRTHMTPEKGIDLEVLEEDEYTASPLLDPEEMDFYVSEFMKNGMRGPCNWYRTRYINWQDDNDLPADTRRALKQPTLHIQATGDNILTAEMTKGMERHVPNLTRGVVPAHHWALWQTPAETNAVIKTWIEGVVLGGKSKL